MKATMKTENPDQVGEDECVLPDNQVLLSSLIPRELNWSPLQHPRHLVVYVLVICNTLNWQKEKKHNK